MNLSEAAFDDFPVWWAANQAEFKASYLSWLHYEGNDRLDIYPAYDYPFTVLFFDINATKVGDDIVLRYDIVSWGMEILMTRWMHDAFMPTERFFENMTFKANITSDMANLDIQTVVAYAVYACETTLVPGGSSTGRGEPCWVWEAMLADYMPSTGIHTHSDFDPYDNKTYVDRLPGSGLYGMIIPYDYTPGAWNLSEGETLTLAWPAGDVQFKRHIAPGSVANETGEMILTAAEPSDSDLPGVVSINDTARTISFSGPVDMWTWSRSQTAHEELASEWSRLGLLPQGVPYLEFKMAMNTPPRAMASLDLTTGDLLTMFEFNASRCYDLEEDAASLMVRWDWDNDGTWDTVWSTDKVEYHQFSATGDYMVMLEVRDGSNMTNLTYVTVHVVDVIPEFSTPLVPILCLMLVVAIVVRLRRRRT